MTDLPFRVHLGDAFYADPPADPQEATGARERHRARVIAMAERFRHREGLPVMVYDDRHSEGAYLVWPPGWHADAGPVCDEDLHNYWPQSMRHESCAQLTRHRDDLGPRGWETPPRNPFGEDPDPHPPATL